MEKADIYSALVRAVPMTPIVAQLVPENELRALVFAARDVVFTAQPDSDGKLDELDRISERFSDLVDTTGIASEREELRRSAQSVLLWLNANCMTVPPIHHIRALVEAAQ